MTFLRYPAYKDSGVEWLGEIPAHWETLQLKRRLYFDVGWTPPTGQSEYFDGDLPWANISDLGPHTITQTAKSISLLAVKVARLSLIPKGSLLFSFKLSIGQVSFAGIDLYSNEAIAAFPPQPDVDLRFMYYALPLYAVQNANENIYGAKLLNQDLIKNACILDVPLIEQHAIAAFLDAETARIDTLVAKQVSLIATLQEKRRALISHVVTKGLDPAAPMKDSGVPWLGEVPKHWEVKAIKWLSPVQRGASPRPIDDPKYFDDEGEYAWVRIADVTAAEDGYLRITTQRLSPLGSSLSVKLDPGALFLSIAGSVGKPCISCIKACIHDGFVYFPHLRENNKFLFYIFEAGTAFQGLGKLGTQLNLNTDTVGSIRIGVPPKVEQDAIVAFIERESDRVDTLITKSQEMIAVLREHRTALVAAAVTGQIDVREPSRESGRIK